MSSKIPTFIMAGPIRMEYFLLPGGQAQSHILGGPALYAAAAAKVWTSDCIGLVSRVGSNFSSESLREIEKFGLDTAGIHLLPKHPPTLGFHYYQSWEKHIDWDPAKHYSQRNVPLPQELLDYSPPAIGEGSIHHFPEIAIRCDDIPNSYQQTRAAYISPCHYQSQITLSVSLRQSGVGTLLLSPPEGLLLPSFRSQIRDILHGIDILFAREECMQTFVGDPHLDSTGISEYLSKWGPKIIILQRGSQGISAYDSDSRKSLFVPFYPSELKNPSAIGDAFCGGFLVSWRKSYNLLESTLVGCISASLATEGWGGLYALQRNPGLADARLTSLRQTIQK
jgi:sugar/nucleoside kinase (ribokinase family)